MSETLTHGATLARHFYDEYRNQFVTAFAAASIKDKYFILAADEFDEFLVSHSVIGAAASVFDTDSVERRGITLLRNEARRRINLAALKAENFSAYTIGPAKNGHLKVRLVMLYAQEAPQEIAQRVRASTTHHQRVIRGAIKILDQSAHVRDEDRAAMKAFSRFMAPMLDAFASGMTSAVRDAENTKRRMELKRKKLDSPE
jgi:hypothetical protein